MKILLIGGLGYVGGRLTDYLCQEFPAHTIAVSTVRDKIPSWAKNLNVFKLDVRDQKTIENSLICFKPDVVVHLGAVDQHFCQSNPDAAYDINVKGTKRLCKKAFEFGVKKIVYVSTFQVYGKFSGNITENQQAIPDPQKIYAVTKKEAEDIVLNSPLRSIVIRLSNAFGRPMDHNVSSRIWTLAMNAFVCNCLEGKDIYPRDNVYRDFISMTDAVRAISHLSFREEENWNNDIFNLGGESTLSVVEAAEKVVAVYRQLYDKTINVIPPKDVGYSKFIYCIDKLKTTGFKLLKNNDELAQTFKYLEVVRNNS